MWNYFKMFSMKRTKICSYPYTRLFAWNKFISGICPINVLNEISVLNWNQFLQILYENKPYMHSKILISEATLKKTYKFPFFSISYILF